MFSTMRHDTRRLYTAQYETVRTGLPIVLEIFGYMTTGISGRSTLPSFTLGGDMVSFEDWNSVLAMIG